MKKYHIVYFNSENDFYSTGKTYEDVGPIEAMTKWQIEFPTAIFSACYIVEY